MLRILFIIFFAFQCFLSVAQSDSITKSDYRELNYLIKNQYLDSAQYFLTKLKATDSLSPKDTTELFYYQAYINLERGLIELSIEQLQQVLLYYQKKKNVKEEIYTIILIANAYGASSNYEIAKFWNRKGIKLLEKNYNAEQHRDLLINIANNYPLNAGDSTFYFYKKAEGIQERFNLKKDDVLIYNIGTIHYLNDDYSKAINYYLQSYNLKVAYKDSSTMIYPAIELALCYLLKNDIKNTEKWLKISSAIPKNLESKKRYYEIKAEYHRQLEQFDEYDEGIRNYIKYYKQILNDKQLLNVQELNEKYLSDQKTEQIKKQKLQLEVNRNKIELNERKITLRNRLIGIISLAVFALVILILLIRQRTKRIKKESEVKLLEAKIEGENETRKLIGRNMHDFVLSDLHAIRFKLEGLQYLETIDKKELEKVTEDLRLNTKELRTISHELASHNKANDEVNFKQAIEQSLKVLMGATEINIELNFEQKAENHLNSKETINALIGVIKEAVTNAVKHAKCSLINVNIYLKDGKLYVSITDDGLGFDQRNKGGIGLENMKDRINRINGELNIITNEKGTSVKITI